MNMTVRELITLLLQQPVNAEVYVGRGVGPLQKVTSQVAGNTGTDRIYVTLSAR